MTLDKRWCCSLALALVFVLTCCQATVKAAVETAAPISIEADRMESSSEQQIIAFSGHVEARQGDIRIIAEEMTVTYVRPSEDQAKPTGKTGQDGGDGGAGDVGRNIRKLVASNGVEITKQDWKATGDHLEFFAAENKVIMTGNAKAWQNQNMVTGDRIVLFLDEGKSVVERDKDTQTRVKAFIYPEATSGSGVP